MLFSFVVYWHDLQDDITSTLNSIQMQKHNYYEVIILDCNLSESETVVSEFLNLPNFKYFKCENNDYLHIGAEHAQGDYLQYIDAGDLLPIDWLYQIEQTLSQTSPELILTNQYYKNHQKMFLYNFSISKFLPEKIESQELLSIYLQHGGEDRSITSINNKIVDRKFLLTILEQCEFSGLYLPDYLVFSLYLSAKSIYYCKSGNFIYNLKKEVSFYSENYSANLEAFKKLLEQITLDLNNHKLCKFNEIEWRYDWYKEWYKRLSVYFPNDQKKLKSLVDDTANKHLTIKHDTSFFESATTPLQGSYQYYENIKKFIASEECEYVGFDIFDTLIQRPFWEPTDLFHLLNHKFNQLLNHETCIDFSLIRMYGEQACRGYYNNIRPSNEDVNLDEIYGYIEQFYGIDSQIIKILKEFEIELELKYCTSREIGKELFNWAKYCNKKIIIVSDMYLSKEVISRILEKNNYKNYQKLYLSNDIGISKYSGRLFEYLLKDLKIELPSSVCFVGDNYGVDFVNSQKFGMIPFHVPKATDLFQGLNQAIYTGKLFEKIYQPNGSMIDQGTVLKFLGIRCMMAVVANKIFGNPFVNFNNNSDFNADPQYIGYYCGGSFLLSEAKWLLQETIPSNINTIHFVSRDGFWIKEAYDRLHKLFPKGANSNYLYFSRKAVAPLYLENKEGIYELFLPPHILSQTPESVLRLLDAVLQKTPDIDYKKLLRENGIIPEKKFGSLHQFYVFAKVFEEKFYHRETAQQYKTMLYQYFKNIIHKNDVICDVGYSGRMETALTKLLGFPVNSYYFHEHEPMALMRKRSMNFSIQSFYDFKPCSAFVLREQLFTPAQPSCIGFEKTEDGISPKFGQYHAAFKENFILSIFQNQSIQFVEDMISIFGADFTYLDFNKFDACIPFEFYLHYSTDFDRKVLSAIDFEDEFGTNAVISMQEYWREERKTYSLNLYVDTTSTENSPQIQITQHPVTQSENPQAETSQDKAYDSQTDNNQNDFVQNEISIYSDGVYIKFLKRLNQVFPLGSRRRNIVKRIVNIFVH